jgi:hypothetical protein
MSFINILFADFQPFWHNFYFLNNIFFFYQAIVLLFYF